MAIVTTAWKYPGTVVNGVSGETGTNDWASPANITADDGSEASSAFAGTRSRTLRASNFGFTTADIPAAATINGIEVRIERRESDANRISDVSLYIVPDKSGGNVADRVGDNKADTVTKWPTSVAVANYGSSSDKWSSGLTPAQAVSSSFAIDFEAQSSLGGIGYVDFLQVRITWEMPTVTGTADIAEGADSAAGGSAYVPALDLDFITSETPDPRITFSGGANGTRVNAAGQIVAASAPRYDYDPVTREAKGLLIEESRTNLLLRSSEFDVIWSQVGGSITANADIGPDGALSADLFVEGATTTAYGIDQAVTVTAGVQTLSYLVKYAGRRWIRIAPYGGASPGNCSVWFDILNGVMGVQQPNCTGTITPAGNGWYRITWTATTTAGTLTTALRSATGDNLAGNPAGLNGPAYYLWGAQLEAGGSATSNILTGATQVTRTTDSAVISGADFSGWYNQDAGSLIVSFDRNVGLDAVDRSAVTLDVGSASSRIIAYSQSTGRAIGVTGGSTSFLFTNLGSITVGSRNALALAYANDDYAACMNGGALSTDTSGAVPTANRMAIGGGSGVSALNGHVRRIRYFNERLPNTLLQTFSTMITGAGAPTEANDNVVGSGKVKVQGTAAIVEGDDVAAGAGETGIHLVTPAGRIAAVGASRLSNRTAR